MFHARPTMPPCPLNTSPNIQAENSGKWAKNLLIYTVKISVGGNYIIISLLLNAENLVWWTKKLSNIYSKFTYRWAKIFFIPSPIAIFKPFLQGVLKKFHQVFTFAKIYISA